jgi:hypothetical protein
VEGLRRALLRFGMRRALLLLMVAAALLIAIQGWLWLSRGRKAVGFPRPRRRRPRAADGVEPYHGEAPALTVRPRQFLHGA